MPNLKQKVTVQVYDREEGGVALLDTSELRIDFDVRMIRDFSRAMVVIYNLNNTTITSLMSGERYVTLKTQLHDGPEYTLVNRYYVNNATDQLILPNRITKLFCLDNLKRGVLEHQVDVNVEAPTLEKCINRVLDEAGHTGKREFLRFPTGRLALGWLRPTYPLIGNVGTVLKKLGKQYKFNTYTVDGGFTFMYKPDMDNVETTTLGTDEVITLTDQAMRSNPVVGIGNAKIDSNLDPSIIPGVVVDLGTLLTVATELDANPDLGNLNDDYLTNLSEYSRYQANAVTHIGSNYTDQWNTTVTALSPAKGKLMDTIAWARGS